VPLWHIDDDGRRSPVYVGRNGKRTTVHAHDAEIGTFTTRAQLDRLLKGLALRPRAQTLSIFLRLCVADLFIHGVGGANYDTATDVMLRNYFGIEPPRYGVASATVRLPLQFDDELEDRLRGLTYRARRLTWNPDEFVPKTDKLRQEKAHILQAAGEHLTRAEHERIESIRTRLLDATAPQRLTTANELDEARAALADQHRLGSRDFPYLLYPLPYLMAAMQEPRTTMAG